MRILIQSALAFAVTPELGYGGMERLAWDFADELRRQGHEVALMAPDNTIPPNGVELIGVGFDSIPNLNLERNAYENRMDSWKNFEVVHDLTHQHWFPRMCGLDIPSMSVFWHDPEIARFPQPDHNVVSLSEWAAERFEKVYGQEAKFQETILVDTEKYIYDSNVKVGDFLVFVGKMSHEKGALDAVRICKRAGMPLVIIGGKGLDTDPDDYQKQVINESTGDIKFLGNVSDEVKIECMQKARGLIYPVNQMEVTSYKNMEALMCGCPVITYNRGAMFHTIDNGKTGFLAEDEDGMIEAIQNIDSISRKFCHEESVRRWGKENVVRNYLSLYKEVAEGLRWF